MPIRPTRTAATRAAAGISLAARGSTLATQLKRSLGGVNAHKYFLSDQLATLKMLLAGFFVMLEFWLPIPSSRFLIYAVLRPTMTDPGRELSRVQVAVLKLMFGRAEWKVLETRFLNLDPKYTPIFGPAPAPPGCSYSITELWKLAFAKEARQAHPQDAYEDANDVRVLIANIRQREFQRNGKWLTMGELRCVVAGHLVQESLNDETNEQEVFNGTN